MLKRIFGFLPHALFGVLVRLLSNALREAICEVTQCPASSGGCPLCFEKEIEKLSDEIGALQLSVGELSADGKQWMVIPEEKA